MPSASLTLTRGCPGRMPSCRRPWPVAAAQTSPRPQGGAEAAEGAAACRRRPRDGQARLHIKRVMQAAESALARRGVWESILYPCVAHAHIVCVCAFDYVQVAHLHPHTCTPTCLHPVPNFSGTFLPLHLHHGPRPPRTCTKAHVDHRVPQGGIQAVVHTYESETRRRALVASPVADALHRANM